MKNKMHRLTSNDILCSKNRRCTEAVSFCKCQRKKALHTHTNEIYGAHRELEIPNNQFEMEKLNSFFCRRRHHLTRKIRLLLSFANIFRLLHCFSIFFFCFLIRFSLFSVCCCCFLFVCRSYIYIWFFIT